MFYIYLLGKNMCATSEKQKVITLLNMLNVVEYQHKMYSI